MNRSFMSVIIVGILLLIVILSGCDLFNTNRDSKYSVIQINIPSSRSLLDDVGTYNLTISGSDFDTIETSFSDSTLSIEVLKGTDRTFTLDLYNDDQSLKLYSGSKTIDLIADVETIALDVYRTAFQLIYNGNEISGGTLPETVYYNAGSSIELPDGSDLIKDGYTFTGWSTTLEGLVLDSITMPAADTTLYAIWTDLPTYNITYDLGGGLGTIPVDSTNYLEGDVVTLSSGSGLTLDGYTFTGWSTTLEGSVLDSFTMPAADTTLYAIWTDLPTYNITYNLSGGLGTVPVDSTNYLEGGSVTLASASGLTYDGYTFAGWATESGGSILASYTMPAYDTTLYAVWTNLPTYSLTYDINGGESIAPSEITGISEGSIVSLDDGTSISKAGYVFMGWSINTFGSWKSFNYTMPAMDITLYAMWIETTAYAFTNAGVVGRYGPSQEDIDIAYSGTTNEGLITIFPSHNGYQQWSVPTTGTYLIEVFGAAGGESENDGDNTGAVISGEFSLVSNDKLIIIVGQEGETRVGDFDAGSGGGTFVVSDPNGIPLDGDDIPLIIAGGGSGETSDAGANPGSDTEIPTGTAGYPNGLGYGGGDASGPGGGGFYSNGQSTLSGGSDCNGLSYYNGLIGGNYYGTGVHGIGGFGGGSGGYDEYGTAGGGYTGGTGRDATGATGGGGSYNSGENQVNIEGTNEGHGLVIITQI